MRHIKIEAEISARSYKKLVAELKNFNKKQLWKVMDHYIFHIMEDKHVEELLKILESLKQTDSFDEPHEVAAETEIQDVYEDFPEQRIQFDTLITADDIMLSKDNLDLLFDVSYFSYLTPDAAVENAKRLVSYAASNELPIPAHWHYYSEHDEE